MVTDRTLARYGMGAVALTGAVIAVVGSGLFADGLVRGYPLLVLGGYALGAVGGALGAVLAWYHREEPGTTASLAGAPASMGAVALLFAVNDPTTPFLPLVLVAVALALVGSGTATYAEATA